MLGVIVSSETHLPEINKGAGDFAARTIDGSEKWPNPHSSITVTKDGKPIAAVILHSWYEKEGIIELSGAGSGAWQSRRVLNIIFGLCFDVMGCQMVIMKNNASNEASVRNSRRLGFQGQLIRRLAGRHEDVWIFTLTDEEWATSRLNTNRNRAMLSIDAAPSNGPHDRETP